MNGNRLKFLLASFLFLVLINVADAQRLKVNRIKKRFDAGEWQEMQLELNEYKEDRGEDALVLFFQTKIDIRSIQDKNGLRLAVFKLQKAVDTYALLDAKDAEHYCEKQILCIDFISEFKLQTTLQLWSKIKEDRALNEIEDFINTFPNLNEIHEMIAFRDEVAFQNIEHSKDRKAFENYIQSYPASAFVDKAKKIIEQLAFDEASGLYTIKALEGFIAEFPMSPMVSEAKALILKIEWEQVSVSDDYDALTQFYQLYASSVYGPECKKLLVAIEWRKMKTVENIRELEKWQKQNGEFPEGQQALEKLKVMKDFALPYLNKNNKYNLYCEWDGKVDRSVEFDDFVMVPNGDFVIQKDGKYGVMDKRGKTKLQPVYHQIEVGKGEYLIRINRNYQIFRADGTFLNLPYKHVEQSDWNGDLLMVTDYVNGQAKAGVISWKGKILMPLKYEKIRVLDNGLIGTNVIGDCYEDVDIEGEQELYSLQGKYLKHAVSFSEAGEKYISYNVNWSGNGCGIMDTSGLDIFAPQFSIARGAGEEGVFLVDFSDRVMNMWSQGVVDYTGKTLVNPAFNLGENFQWLGNGLYASIADPNARYDDWGDYRIRYAETGKPLTDRIVKHAFAVSPGTDSKFLLVLGDDYAETIDASNGKSISRIFTDSIGAFDYGDIHDWDDITNENIDRIYCKNDLSSEVTSGRVKLLSNGVIVRSSEAPWSGAYLFLNKNNSFLEFNFGDKAWLIEKSTGRIAAYFPEANIVQNFGQYTWIVQNSENKIVDANNKELNVTGDIDFAGPISDSKFFYQVSKNGNKETFIYDSEKKHKCDAVPWGVSRYGCLSPFLSHQLQPAVFHF